MQTQTLIIGLGILALTICLDLFNRKSVAAWPLRHRCIRLLTWLPVACSYASLYLGRYNLAAINVPAIRELIGLSAMQLGVVSASGMWSYAFTAPVTGALASRIGPWAALTLGIAGAGVANLAVLPLLQFHLSGWALTGGLGGCYAINMVLQGFATASCVQLIAVWYGSEERGLFSGIFNTWINFGYLLALSSEVQIVTALSWPYAFAVPGAALLLAAAAVRLAAVCSPLGRSMLSTALSSPSPEAHPSHRSSVSLVDASPSFRRPNASPEEEDRSYHILPMAGAQHAQHGQHGQHGQCATEGSASLGATLPPPTYAELLSSREFLRYLLGVSLLTWVRDGLITWVLSFLAARSVVTSDGASWLIRGSPSSGDGMLPPPNEAIGLVIFLGGATGGVILGAVSDAVFAGQRRPPLLLFTGLQAAGLVLLNQPGLLLASPYASCTIVFFLCFFTLGSYSLLCYGIPIDLGERLASTAAGVMTCCQYLASGAGSVAMGAVVNAYGFQAWWAVMLAMTLAEFLAIALL